MFSSYGYERMLLAMQLNVARLRYHLGSALSALADGPPLEAPAHTRPPNSPKGELKRSVNARISPFRHEQLKWIAPRLNMSLAEFTRVALDALIDHVIDENPQILVENFPNELPRDQSQQMSLFSATDTPPTLVVQSASGK